jgi:foldase protein PrsA
MSLRKRIGIVGMIGVFLIALVAGGSGYLLQRHTTTTTNDSDVVATFSGGQVTEAEYRKMFNFQRKLIVPTFEETNDSRTQFLQEYITLHKIMVPQAQKAGIKVDEKGLDQQVQDYKNQVVDLAYGGDSKKFADQLAAYGITDDDIKNNVRDEEVLRQYKEQKVGAEKVTDAEVKTYYDSHKEEFDHGTISQILVKTQEEAKKVKDRLTHGEDFAKVANEVSLDPTAKQNGGKLEDVQFSMFEQQFQDVASKQKLGTLSEPFSTSLGWHVIVVNKRVTPSFDEVKKDAQAKALDDKQNSDWDAFYAKTVSEADIQIAPVQ